MHRRRLGACAKRGCSFELEAACSCARWKGSDHRGEGERTGDNLMCTCLLVVKGQWVESHREEGKAVLEEDVCSVYRFLSLPGFL